ncbi:1,4-alpha-glucan branching protein GlgB [Candidatus Methylacidiphilum infernorum]|uniref:1,4-alpha-glucan branching enzyme GlgB n=1 Tax=Methylacidiphilum infernorum (isolate V4) TaxID=481448 RepID=B3DUS6_METI4|nr:1,4-alpha-glucan branching protein GlgB [Candidatus Methylacidiphilum infernorum]ACD83079.1 1,4-alpha-glucan branching enzyme [Methylacidiphilum infernorum V4]
MDLASNEDNTVNLQAQGSKKTMMKKLTTPLLAPYKATPISLFSDYDIYLFKKGTHYNLYDKLGCHLLKWKGKKGAYFAVWAPNAQSVSVIGSFNGWNPKTNPMSLREDQSGIWETFIPGVAKGDLYKYHIVSKADGGVHVKGDPFAFLWEVPPKSASMVWNLEYTWLDKEWMDNKTKRNGLNSPWNIYEVHLGSWKRKLEENNRFLNYREIALLLASYVKEMGYTHVEFLPVMEHPYYGSWGYQTLGYFAPTSRYGFPQDFMFLIDYLHRNGIGVILDWVPSHFATDGHGLGVFDGTHLYEHADPRQGYHPDWGSYIFNYGRYEVKEFLISSARFWFEKYHVDGLRIDAVASMLYLDYSRKPGEWIPNKYGGNENLEAIDFLRTLNETLYKEFRGIQLIAEESTAYPMVTRPTYVGGLGFGFKWNMGWMHDSLFYFSLDPIFRKYHQNRLTFSAWYAFQENFILSLSHDEVVYGKGSLLRKMPGDNWQKFANLRALFSYQFFFPGHKLLFMGGEFGQWDEWYHEKSLDWHLASEGLHGQLCSMVKYLNFLYKSEKALYGNNFSPKGFCWIDFSDYEKSIISFMRRSADGKEHILCVFNFTPVPRENYIVGAPFKGYWKMIFNSDAPEYGGSGIGNSLGKEAVSLAWQGQPYSLSLTLPPLACLAFKKIHEDQPEN